MSMNAWSEVVLAVACVTAASAVIAWTVAWACWLARHLRYRHQQSMARVRRLADPAPLWHEPQCERVGQHRAVWSGSLDDQPAGVIAAIITDAPRRPK